jgi:hypothetical protein
LSLGLEKVVIGIALVTSAALPARATGIIINPTWGWSTSTANQATLESTIDTVIGIYEANLTTSNATPVTVNIRFTDSTTSLGSTSWSPYSVTYQDYVNALTSHALTTDDIHALLHLPPGPNSPVNDINGAPTTLISIKPANMKALGLSFGFNGPPEVDATIGLETSIMNLSRTGTQVSSNYDLESVVMHEMDEALGLGSTLGVGVTNPSPEDFFRYTGSGTGGSPCSTVSGRSFTTSSTAQGLLFD